MRPVVAYRMGGFVGKEQKFLVCSGSNGAGAQMYGGVGVTRSVVRRLTLTECCA